MFMTLIAYFFFFFFCCSAGQDMDFAPSPFRAGEPALGVPGEPVSSPTDDNSAGFLDELIYGHSPELFSRTPAGDAGDDAEDAATRPATPSGDDDSGPATDVASDSDDAEEDAAANALPVGDILAELKNEAIFRIMFAFLCCRDDDCRDFKCLQHVQHAREFPTGAAACLPGSGINMYYVFMFRHAYVRWGYDCGDPNCRGARAYISKHLGRTVVRCRKPCNRVRHRPFKDQNHPLFSGRHPERVLVYVACLVWGMPVPLCRTTACHTHRRLSVQLNKLMGAVAAAFNARQVAVELGTWVIAQADEMAIGARKNHVGQSPRVGGVVWVVGVANIVNKKVVAISCSVVVKRDAAAISRAVLPLLNSDAVLTTDKWRAYSKALKDAESNVTHHQVNHSVEFKTKEGHHTNHIEGMWRVVRKELKVRWSRCGTHDPTQQDNRVQFGVWVINHRLGQAETGIIQAMMVLLMNHDLSVPPPSAFDVNDVPEKDKQVCKDTEELDEEGANENGVSDGDSDNDSGEAGDALESDDEPPATAMALVERSLYRNLRNEKAAAATKRRDANKAKREAHTEAVKKRKEERAVRKAANDERLQRVREERARKAAAKQVLNEAQEALKEARKRMQEERRNAARAPPAAPPAAHEG
jgi:IS1 family transposase